MIVRSVRSFVKPRSYVVARFHVAWMKLPTLERHYSIKHWQALSRRQAGRH